MVNKTKLSRRPRRIFKDSKGYYYLIRGKKKRINLDGGISQKQLVKINIHNVVPVRKRAPKQRRESKKEPTLSHPVVSEIPRVPLRQAEYNLSQELLARIKELQQRNLELSVPKTPLNADDVNKPTLVSVSTQTPEFVARTPVNAYIFYALENLPTSLLQNIAENATTPSVKFDVTKRNDNNYLINYIYDNTKLKDVDKYEAQSIIDNWKRKFGGKGTASRSKGLWNDQIEKILSTMSHRMIPVITLSDMSKIPDVIKPSRRDFGWIMNVGNHWVAVVVSRRDKTIEYYDSLAENPPKKFWKLIKPIVDKLGDEVMYKYKQNHVRDQALDSSECGYFAINFIKKRLIDGEAFKDASFYTKVIKGRETDGKGLKRKYQIYL